jgi:hypothetical protein
MQMTDIDSPTVSVVANSGVLRVTVHPRPERTVALVIMGVDLLAASLLYELWSSTPFIIRAIWLWALVYSTATVVRQYYGDEVIEFDARKLTIRKGIYGWERGRECRIEACSELGWERGWRNGPPSLTCNVDSRPIRFGYQVSEADANQIFSSLQQALPEVAQTICARRDGKEHAMSLNRDCSDTDS